MPYGLYIVLRPTAVADVLAMALLADTLLRQAIGFNGRLSALTRGC